MDKIAYYTGYMDKEAFPLYFGKHHKAITKMMPRFARKLLRKYNVFIRGKHIPTSSKMILDNFRREGLKRAKDGPSPINSLRLGPLSFRGGNNKMFTQADIKSKYMELFQSAQGDTAKIHKLMVYLGVLPPVAATAAGTAITAVGAAAPYVVPPSFKQK